METRRATNILLLLIFLCLVVSILSRIQPEKAYAETFMLDDCVTSGPYEEPKAYVHVVVHNVSPVQARSELR